MGEQWQLIYHIFLQIATYLLSTFNQQPWRNFAKIATFLQIRRFRQICQHFRAPLAGLIYSLLSFRQQPWRNFFFKFYI